MRVAAVMVASTLVAGSTAGIASASESDPQSSSEAERVPVVAAETKQVEIENRSGRPDSSVYVMLTAKASSYRGSLNLGSSQRLTSLTAVGSNRYSFSVSQAESARIWLSYDEPLVADPEPSPDTSKIRFDTVELTYLPGTAAIANLSAVAMFGVPMDLQAVDAAGGVVPDESKGYRCYTDTIRERLRATGVDMTIVERKTAAGDFARIVAPATIAAGYPDLGAYVDSQTGREITLAGRFDGQPAGQFRYSGRFGQDGSISLTGTVPTGADPAKTLHIAGNSIPDAIYTQNGPYTVGGVPAQVGDNDVYSAMYRDFIVAFAYGYWGGRYGDDAQAFNSNPPPAAFSKARLGPEPYSSWHVYAEVFNEFSNSYGMPFSDTFHNNGKGNPLLSFLASPTLRATILPDAGCKAPKPPPNPPKPPTPTPAPVTPKTYLRVKARAARARLVPKRWRLVIGRVVTPGDPAVRVGCLIKRRKSSRWHRGNRFCRIRIAKSGRVRVRPSCRKPMKVTVRISSREAGHTRARWSRTWRVNRGGGRCR